jgi:type IV secretory pathway VirB9-like protein
MQYWWLVLGMCLLAGCQPGEPPPPPTAPVAEDLSTWAVPELVQPERQAPRAHSARPTKVPAGAAEKVYDYTPGVTVEVPVALDQPLDIVLEAGEQVRQIVDGDRAPAEQGQARRWEVREGGDGLGDGLRPHVFVTVTAPGLTNGITITTTRRVYYIACKSVAKSPTRVLRWHYPPEAHPTALPLQDAPGLLPHPEHPMRYHVGYEIATRQPAPAWTPRQIVDDGKKLYLLYPEVTLFTTVPLVRLLGVNGPQLVNARQYLNVVILDQLAPALELRVGVGPAAEVVTVTRGKGLRTITCPDDGADCPQWPEAARQLVRRTP